MTWEPSTDRAIVASAGWVLMGLALIVFAEWNRRRA